MQELDTFFCPTTASKHFFSSDEGQNALVGACRQNNTVRAAKRLFDLAFKN